MPNAGRMDTRRDLASCMWTMPATVRGMSRPLPSGCKAILQSLDQKFERALRFVPPPRRQIDGIPAEFNPKYNMH